MKVVRSNTNFPPPSSLGTDQDQGALSEGIGLNLGCAVCVCWREKGEVGIEQTRNNHQQRRGTEARSRSARPRYIHVWTAGGSCCCSRSGGSGVRTHVMCDGCLKKYTSQSFLSITGINKRVGPFKSPTHNVADPLLSGI